MSIIFVKKEKENLQHPNLALNKIKHFVNLQKALIPVDSELGNIPTFPVKHTLQTLSTDICNFCQRSMLAIDNYHKRIFLVYKNNIIQKKVKSKV